MYVRAVGCRLVALGALVLGSGGGRWSSAQDVRLTVLRDHGGQVSWSPTGDNHIAYATKGADGYYDVHVADATGANDACLTCDTPGLPKRHVGGPSWHPRGRYLLLVVEKPEHPGTSYDAIPGFGGYSDIWCVTRDGRRAKRLTAIPVDADHGLLVPRFSPDGARVAWTERVARPKMFSLTQLAGYWALRVADFVETPAGPVLRNVKAYAPGGRAFHEGYGFTPDGRRLLFCSSMNQPSFWDEDIYSIDASTGGDFRKLTSGNYNEHAFCTPDGASIVWMTNRGSTRGGTDWWVMNADGSDKRRLTYFNEPGHAQDMGRAVWAGLGSFAPEGNRFVGDIQLNLITQEATIRLVDLVPRRPRPRQ